MKKKHVRYNYKSIKHHEKLLSRKPYKFELNNLFKNYNIVIGNFT